MGWFTNKSPFGANEDPVRHMITLLSDEAQREGMPFTDSEKVLLASDDADPEPLTEELRQKVKGLILRIFEAETDEFERAPQSFSSSLQWAGDRGYTNIVALAEEVSCEMAGGPYPPLQGWGKMKDRILLIGCGLIVVLVMFAIGAVGTIYFGWK